MASKLSNLWVKHLRSPEDIEALNKAILGSTVLRNRLSEIIKEKLQALDNAECSVSDYDNPSWSHKQAHRNGQKASLVEVLKLIDL